MKLILSGGGIGEKCHASYKKFAEEVNGKPVLFIPFANDEASPEDALDWFKNEVKPFGITNIETVKTPKEITLSLLNQFGGVYFSGGNTFLLLSELKKYNAFEEIQKFLNCDGVIMGGSAGATIFGKSIDTCLKDDLKIIASDENYVGLKETAGFDAINGYSLFVHYKVKERQYADTELRVQRLLKDGHNLICLPEETSLFVDNGKISIIGDLPAEIITKTFRDTVNPNQQIENCHSFLNK